MKTPSVTFEAFKLLGFLTCTNAMAYFAALHTDHGFRSALGDCDGAEVLLQTHPQCEPRITYALRVLCVGCLFCIFVLYMGFLNVTVKCILNSHRQKK